MSYIINKTNGEQLLVLQDAVVDRSTSLQLVGRNFVGYGELQNENFVFLMENFSNANPPTNPIEGQTWFDSQNNILNVFTRERWQPVSAPVFSETAPQNPRFGTFWYRESTQSMSMWDGVKWRRIGPEAADGFGETRYRSLVVKDTDNNDRPIILALVDDVPVAITSHESFILNPNQNIPGFDSVSAGITLAANRTIRGNLNGTAAQADKLTVPKTINGTAFDGSDNIETEYWGTTRLITLGATSKAVDGASNVSWTVPEIIPQNTNLSINSLGIGTLAVGTAGSIRASTLTADSIAGNLTGNVSGNLVGDVVGNVTGNITGNAETVTNGVYTVGNQTIDGEKAFVQDVVAAGLIVSDMQTANRAGLQLRKGSTQYDVRINLDRLYIHNTARDPSTGVVLFSNDNVGIGVEVPLDKLHVNGNVRIESQATIPQHAVRADRTISAGDGINGGGDLTANRTFSVDGTVVRTSRNIIAGDGLVGGGALSADITVEVDNTVVRNSRNITAGDGILGGGNLSSDRTFSVDSSVVRTTRTITAGSGLSGGGALSSNITLNIDGSVVRTSGNQTITGTKTFSSTVNGNISGNAATATRLQTARTINGVPFDGTTNISVISQATFQSGTFVNTVGFTNIVDSVGSPGTAFRNNSNFFDVFPPSGKTMANFVAFIPSISFIAFNGNVNQDDTMRCQWQNIGDRIRVWVQNTEQRARPRGNFLAVWS